MITVTREFADRVAEVAQLLEADEADEIPDETLRRLTALATRVVHGGAQAPDPAVIGFDQLDDVGRQARLGGPGGDVTADLARGPWVVRCRCGHAGPRSWVGAVERRT